MHRHLHKWHRRIGAFGALIAIYLAITGLLLNHTHDLGLDRTHTRSSLLLNLYNITPHAGIAASTRKSRVSQHGDSLFIGTHIAGRDSGELNGAVHYRDMYLVATSKHLHIFTKDGDLVETLDHSAGLPARIERLGITSAGKITVDDGASYWLADEGLLNWTQTGAIMSVDWSRVRVLSQVENRQLAELAPGAGPSWERVLQDLHSGRLFGTAGTIVIDLTGIVILLLAVSGFITLLMRKRRSRSPEVAFSQLQRQAK